MQIVGIEMKAEAKSVVRLQRHGMPAFCSTYIARLLFITKISKLHMIKNYQALFQPRLLKYTVSGCLIFIRGHLHF